MLENIVCVFQTIKNIDLRTNPESNFLPNIENSGTIGGTGAEGPKKVTKPKSWVASECQIRQWDTSHQGTKQPTVMRFSKSDDCHRFPYKMSSTHCLPLLRIYSGLFFTSIIVEQEKTGNKFYALLISPLLPKVFLIDSMALALHKCSQPNP